MGILVGSLRSPNIRVQKGSRLLKISSGVSVCFVLFPLILSVALGLHYRTLLPVDGSIVPISFLIINVKCIIQLGGRKNYMNSYLINFLEIKTLVNNAQCLSGFNKRFSHDYQWDCHLVLSQRKSE